jgi:hypothetical protein
LIVRCRATQPTDDEAAATGIDLGGLSNPYALTLGKVYVVLGLTFPRVPSLLGTDGAITYTENESYVLQAPLVLFDIVDARASSKWVLGRNQVGDLCIWPPSFFAAFYHDRLSDGDPELRKDFQRLYAELAAESGLRPTNY